MKTVLCRRILTAVLVAMATVISISSCGKKSAADEMEAAIKETEKMTEEELAAYLEAAAKKVDAGEKEGILTLCLQLMCADAFLAQDEVDNFFAFADILGVDEDTATAALDEFVSEEEDLIIEE